MTYTRDILVTLLFLSWVTSLCSRASGTGDSYVLDACNVTRYRKICIRSLSSYSRTAKQDPSKWARAGVSVTIGEAKSASQYLTELAKNNSMEGRNQVALSDCVECFQDSLDNLHRSLGVLRQLSGEMFDTQMGDVTTWLSAALTDEETCLDGFDGERGKQIRILRRKVMRFGCFTSNALALVAKLATAGPSNLVDP